ncbi:MAG: methylenetetrahydrofolate--tRNA-(uracil(54)-C(5))-methyltransferase (FADH(2)-oxidizing) TrmFO [Trueperaceae bacterium]|nr:methylenetetrahydrofolate--tRNA-(uracil(54)-C(5))-methyltransferase (FADH(2)-oxidizing) TrmFO [Trueperaceae bacterium]
MTQHTPPRITVIGAGMAGSDAALAAAKLGVSVDLYEMRPKKMTPAHHTDKFAEMVCSNSFGGEGETNAKGLLQAEMLAAGGLIMTSAHDTRIPAGGALAVDREAFGERVSAAIRQHPNITVHNEELTEIPDGIVVLASGPLTSDALAESIRQTVGMDFLGFYDAAAPVIDAESIDMSIAFRKGRYGQAADYLNLPFHKDDYDRFFEALGEARKHVPHDWEKLEFFEGCMPIEEIARRGYDTPRFGPMKPVGLEHPDTGERFYAVAQLRQEDVRGQMWSLVGFQTGLKWGDQKEVIRMIPGLQNADIVRYGVMHRNTYLNAPKLIDPTLNLRDTPRLFVAGVLAGTEGYLESSATGWLAGSNAARQALGLEPLLPPETSMLGGLVRFLATAESDNFQPMNANWGLVPTLPKQKGEGKKERRMRTYRRGIAEFRAWLEPLTTPSAESSEQPDSPESETVPA